MDICARTRLLSDKNLPGPAHAPEYLATCPTVDIFRAGSPLELADFIGRLTVRENRATVFEWEATVLRGILAEERENFEMGLVALLAARPEGFTAEREYLEMAFVATGAEVAPAIPTFGIDAC